MSERKQLGNVDKTLSEGLFIFRSEAGRPTVRTYNIRDLHQVIDVYKTAFANPPYNEFMKCSNCGINYGKEEVAKLIETDNCKKCNEPLDLVEVFSSKGIEEDIEDSQKRPNVVTLVAEDETGILGFAWGYKVPFDEFPQLKGKVADNASYFAELAVREDKRKCGIGNDLCNGFLRASKEIGINEVVLRTNERNVASLALYKKNGFVELMDTENVLRRVYDLVEKDRIFLSKKEGNREF